MFDLQRSFPNSVGLIPVQFRFAESAIWDAHHCDTFQFTPTPSSVHFAKMRPCANARPRRDDFNVGDFTFDFEFQCANCDGAAIVKQGRLTALPLSRERRESHVALNRQRARAARRSAAAC